MTNTPQYDLYSQDFSRHAYQILTTLRQNQPFLQQPGLDGHTPIWYISRYEDVIAMLRDDRHFSLDMQKVMAPERDQDKGQGVMDMVNNHLLTKDGEDHVRLRALVSQAFSRRRINELRPRIQAIADTLLDQVQSQGKMDLVENYAFLLPINVIAELLGIPLKDRHHFRAWSDIFVTPAVTPDEQKRFTQMAYEFVAYLQALFEERRKSPQDDLISALLQAEEAGDRLNTQELFSMVVLLIIAGHETTVTLIGNATVAMLTHPETKERLKQHPEEMAQAVEEFLRYDAPVNRSVTRIVTEDILFNGQAFKRGDLVIGLLGSANRDERQLADPDQLNIARENRSHLSFGHGVHYCLGSPLARMEGEIALNSLLKHIPDLRLAAPVETLEYREVPLFHAFAHIPVEWK